MRTDLFECLSNARVVDFSGFENGVFVVSTCWIADKIYWVEELIGAWKAMVFLNFFVQSSFAMRMIMMSLRLEIPVAESSGMLGDYFKRRFRLITRWIVYAVLFCDVFCRCSVTKGFRSLPFLLLLMGFRMIRCPSSAACSFSADTSSSRDEWKQFSGKFGVPW